MISTAKEDFITQLQVTGGIVKDPLLFFSPCTRLLYANEAAREWFPISDCNYSISDFQKNFLDHSDQEFPLFEALASEQKMSDIAMLLKSDKKVNLSLEPVFGENQQLEGLLCSLSIFDQRNSDVHDKLKLASDTAGFGVWELDLETNELFWNKKQFEIYGIDREELYASLDTWKEQVHPRDKTRVQKEMNQLSRGKRVEDLEFRIVRGDGAVRTLRASGAPVFGQNGSIRRLVGINIDITELKKNEQALQTNVELLSHALDVANLYFFSVDFKENKLSVKKEIKRLIGLETQEEITLSNFREFIHPEDFDTMVQVFEQSLVTQSFDSAFRICSKKGKVIWLRARGLTSVSYEGHPEKVEGMIQDITVEKTREITLIEQKMLLEQSETRLSRAEKVSKMGHWAINLTDFSYEWSSGAYEIYGIPEGTKITKQLIEAKIHPDDLLNPELRHPLPPIVKHRIIVNGKVKWVQVETDQSYSSDKQIFGTIKDITDEVVSKDQLLESENKYRSIFENISEGYIQLDKDGICLNANPAACTLLNEKHPRNIIGSNFLRKYLTSSKDLGYLRNLLSRSNEINGVEVPLKRTDGSIIISDFHLKLSRKEGQLHVVGTFRDITREVEINDHILSATIEAEDKQRRVIAQNLHDGVQQTLIAAKMNLESIKDFVNDPYLTRVEAGLSFIKQGINEIRTASHNLMPPSLEQDGLAVTLSALVDQLDNTRTNTSFHFITNLTDYQRFLKSVETGIYRIAQEAANNIIKYADASQTVFKLVYEQNTLKLLINDNGKGFDTNNLKDQKEGLGLIGMRNRAISIGGHLELKSWPKRGTSLTLEVDVSEL